MKSGFCPVRFFFFTSMDSYPVINLVDVLEVMDPISKATDLGIHPQIHMVTRFAFIA